MDVHGRAPKLTTKTNFANADLESHAKMQKMFPVFFFNTKCS